MIFESDDGVYNRKRILLECSCGHGILEITQFIDDKEVYIGYKEDGWYTRYKPVRQNIKRFVKGLWRFLSGKEYEHYSILLSSYEIKELKEVISRLNE